MIRATWKQNTAFLFKADAQRVADEIADIGDAATPAQIVEKAKDESTELHKCFTWDNNIAAQKWRLQEARLIVCNLVIQTEPEDKKQPVRVFYKAENGEGYKKADLIFRREDEYQQLLQRALAELHAFKVKYARLSELEEILALID